MRCETCQEEATVHVDVIGCHFCASCLKKIDERIAEMNTAKHKPMNLPLADAYDKLSILLIKQLMSTQDVCNEIQDLRDYIGTFSYCQQPTVFHHLLITNAMIWSLESDIRLGKEGVLGLEEVGRRALKIRDLNAIRMKAKAAIAEWAGEPVDRKVDHASAPTQTKQEPVAHTDDLTGHTD